jgi:hypothetical protein
MAHFALRLPHVSKTKFNQQQKPVNTVVVSYTKKLTRRNTKILHESGYMARAPRTWQPLQFIGGMDFKWRTVFSQLKTLLLTDWCVGGDFNGLIYFIQHSTILERLTVQLEDYKVYDFYVLLQLLSLKLLQCTVWLISENVLFATGRICDWNRRKIQPKDTILGVEASQGSRNQMSSRGCKYLPYFKDP